MINNTFHYNVATEGLRTDNFSYIARLGLVFVAVGGIIRRGAVNLLPF